ncbi:MAG: PPOX class F420-dependent oxidoreductase [Chloroflexi bacterium]|nr:PPOX class F420-dependent oxidoreductase [Chloroflexota bacterium]
MANFDLFKTKKFINIETFRKNGVGVKTPVWFVEINEELCFTTESDSGKVKRMKNNPNVRIAPCKMDGTVTGDWCDAKIRFMEESEFKNTEKSYNKKYGVTKLLFDLGGLFRKKRIPFFVAISLKENS